MSINQAQIAKSVRSFQTQSRELNGAFLERKEEVSLLQVSLIAEQPLVFLGLAGVGKSALVNSFAQSLEVGASSADEIPFYQYLLSRYTTPSEIFGIQSVKELRENDRFVINPAGKLPQARVAFLDECFKANSATLNSLLTILNEKQFDDGTGVRKDVPLEMFVGASNEMPEEGEGLEALWDRFVLRHTVEDIQRDDSFISLLTGQGIGEVSCKVSREAVQSLRALRKQVVIDPIIPAMLELRQAMAEAGIRVSGRKWRKAVVVIQAVAALKGRSYAKSSDLGILSSVLWDQQDQVDAIRLMLAKYASDDTKQAMAIADAGYEIVSNVRQMGENIKLKDIGSAKRAMSELINKLMKYDDTEDAVSEAIEKIKSYQAELSKLVLTISSRS